MKALASIFIILILAMVAISLWVNLANAAPATAAAATEGRTHTAV